MRCDTKHAAHHYNEKITSQRETTSTWGSICSLQTHKYHDIKPAAANSSFNLVINSLIHLLVVCSKKCKKMWKISVSQSPRCDPEI